jgi:hypothetical protein
MPDWTDPLLAEGIRLVKARMGANVGKHGTFDPKPCSARRESIERHVSAIKRGDTSEDHWAAVATQALCAIHKRSLDDHDAAIANLAEMHPALRALTEALGYTPGKNAANPLAYPPHHDCLER